MSQKARIWSLVDLLDFFQINGRWGGGGGGAGEWTVEWSFSGPLFFIISANKCKNNFRIFFSTLKKMTVNQLIKKFWPFLACVKTDTVNV